MARTVEVICKCGCGRKKAVRTADIKRGWGLFFDKSCKAREQERRTGQHKAHLKGGGLTREESDHNYAMNAQEAGWDGHKQWL